MVGWVGRVLSQVSGSVGVSSARSNQQFCEALAREAREAFALSPVNPESSFDYALKLAAELLDTYPVARDEGLVKSLVACIEWLVFDCAICPLERDLGSIDHDGEEGAFVRLYLEKHKRFHQNADVNITRFREAVEFGLGEILIQLPAPDQQEQDKSTGFGIRLVDLLSAPEETVSNLIGAFHNLPLIEARLFQDTNERFEQNICAVSGVAWQNASPNAVCLPADFEGSHEDLVGGYLAATPFRTLLELPLSFALPREARFEHTHIVGGTCHGKTQLLSHLILQDIGDLALGKKKSVVVIDSQGDLIRKLTSLLVFYPGHPESLADKLVIIDPSDIDFPTALNIFSLNETRLATYGALERERVMNGAVELYEHFFESLLGAELTQKQGVAFSFLARLMLEIPSATIFTLRDLMEDPRPFKTHIEKLSGSTKLFFEREFMSKAFAQTRRQIARRLWGILAIPAFERMLGQSEHKVDLFELLDQGKIILINTAKDLLKEEGSSLFGKFFLASLAQAVGERAVQSEEARTETIIYLDEAHEYADHSLEILLTQGRKYKAGVVIAHQFLDQLPARTRQSLLANASIKIVGGLSYKDNLAFAHEMNTSTDFLTSLHKQESATEFGLWIKHHFVRALRLFVPFGTLEGLPRLSEGQQLSLRDQTANAIASRLSSLLTSHSPRGKYNLIGQTRGGAVSSTSNCSR